MLVNVIKSLDDFLFSFVTCKNIFNLCRVKQLQNIFL